jgi:hypothetical protein
MPQTPQTKDEVQKAKEEIDSQREALYRDGVGVGVARQREKSLSDQEKSLSALKEVRVRIAFEPSEDFTQEIVREIKKRFGEEYVLDLLVQNNLLGGVVIEADGKYWDYSLKKIFEEKTQ